MARRALITGISGQDGAYLAQLLLEKGYEVYGAYRRSASVSMWRLEELGLAGQVKLVPFELLEFNNIAQVITKVMPDEVYNLAAQSFVGTSFDQPLFTGDVDALGVLRILEALRQFRPEARFYQASTSEMFGKVQDIPQTEATPFYPRSPYGVAKLYGHWITINYREAHGLYCTCGILFNHESPLRGTEFVTRKITSTLARIRRGSDEILELGNLEARRDWGFAGDYVRGMWMMLQQDEGDDFVLSTGTNRSVREFAEAAAAAVDLDLEWQGSGADTTARERASGRLILRINPEFYRPAEVDVLLGDPAKARDKLGWSPEVNFEGLVEMMVKADLDRLAKGRMLM